MRSAFFGLVLCVCGSVYAGDEGSVLVNAAPTPATPEAAVVVAGNACCDSCAYATSAPARVRGRYRVVSESCDACTGRTVRSVSRGVVRGTGEVVRGVGTTAINVVTLPVRAVRGCRSGSCSASGGCCN